MKNPMIEFFDTKMESKKVPAVYFGQIWTELTSLMVYEDLSDNEYALIALEYEERFREIYKDYVHEA